MEEQIQDVQEKTNYNLGIVFRDGKSIIHESIAGYQVGNTVLAVIPKEGVTIIYPLDTIQVATHELV